MKAQEITSMRTENSAIAGIVIIGLVIVIGRVVNWLWLRPKRLERFLRKQNLKGNSYRLGFGDLKEMGQMIQQAKSKPISLDDDIITRVIPFHYHMYKKYGTSIPFLEFSLLYALYSDSFCSVFLLKDVILSPLNWTLTNRFDI